MTTSRAPKCKLIAYRRVSTQGQGRSGLGLEGQEQAIAAYAASSGCKVMATYTEVESGKKNDRPELAKALAHARRIDARLVIAKLDRLTRNARFLLGIVESGADVVFCDLPEVPAGPLGKFMLTQMAAVAELERGMISERTKAALAAYKARGGVMGGRRENSRPNLTDEARAAGRAAGNAKQAREAVEVYGDVAPLILELKAAGMSQQAIAAKLNEDGHTTRTGKPWGQVQVMRVLKRAETIG